jgi:outer membrane protein assembly factor BamA
MPRFYGVSLLLVLSVSAVAETTYTAKKIVFENPGPFTQQQLEDACGMHAGSPLSAGTLTVAAQKLSDSGYFLDIQAGMDGTSANAKAVFALKPAPMEALLPVGFENFVWLSHDEIEKAIVAKFPLFIGRMQETNAAADGINDVLQALLATKFVTAKVVHETVEPTLTHPLRSLEYRVTKPIPIVANMKLHGVGSDLVPLVQKSMNQTVRTPYNEGLSGALTSELILGPVLDAGYAEAKLSDVSPEPAAATERETPVVVSAMLAVGSVYHVSGVQFAATDIVTEDAFNAGVKLHTGDVASRKSLLETLSPVDKTYRSLGYMDVIVKADPTYDEAAHTIAYAVSVVPGEQYRVHDLQVQGLDAAAKAEFDAHFAMKQGEVFNPYYVLGFTTHNADLKTLRGYAGNFKAYADPNTHTVDVVISFFPGPPGRY